MQSFHIYKPNEINLHDIKIKNSYISYKESGQKLLIQTENIKITSHGIPPIIDKLEKPFIRIPLDPNQESCEKLKEFLMNLDEYFLNLNELKFKYKYSACVQQSRSKADLIFCKMKFTDFDLIKFYEVNENEMTQIPIQNYHDIKTRIKFGSECKFIIYCKGIWTNKFIRFEDNRILFGIDFRIMAIQCTKNSFNYNDLDLLISKIDLDENNFENDIGISYKDFDLENDIGLSYEDSVLIVNEILENECCICFDEIKQRVKLIPCGHNQFCKGCIEKIESKICPICRQIINKY